MGEGFYFTAAEARKLAGPTLQEKVASLLFTIKELAINKERQCITSYQHQKNDDLWVHGGYSQTAEWKEAKQILEKLGYEVSFYYSEGSIAVDMYTLVKW
jgi:hypothetical protein